MDDTVGNPKIANIPQRVFNRTLYTRGERDNQSNELVLDNGEAVSVWIDGMGFIHLGCVTISRKAYKAIQETVEHLDASFKAFK